MTATPNFAADARAEPGAGDASTPVASTGPFVLNLCSSTTPMALAQTDLPELKRFTFFVSRRFEEGRERFRLHMGYFATLAEAEEWLSVVREIYPGAWAGEAPGRKLRERAAAAAAAAAQAQHAAGPQQSSPGPTPAAPAPHPFAAAPPPVSLEPDPIPVLLPVLQAAPSVPPTIIAAPSAPVARKPAAPTAPPAQVPIAAPPVQKAAQPAPAPAAARKPPAVEPRTFTPAAAAAADPRAVAASVAAAAQTRQSAAAAPSAFSSAHAQQLAAASLPAGLAPEKAAAAGGVFGDSNVREVLKALGDASATGETRQMRVPSPPRAPVAPPAKEALSDTQVLKLLEVRRPEVPAGQQAQPQDETAHRAIPLLKPDDTGTREALKDAVASNAAVLFAVQLQWSVQAIELEKVPPLAIFSAYTLYTVEGSRDGRKWYGLRLGFFSDAISAKQVAHYVRSEFAAVAVVPVSAQEKSRATDQDKQAATLGGAPAPAAPVDEFKLIDEASAAATAAAAAVKKFGPRTPQPATTKGQVPALSDAAGRKIPGRPVPKAAAEHKPAASTRAKAPPAKQRPRPPAKVGAGETRGAQSLEETLEILGAGQLAIDNGKGETLNESGVRHLRVEIQKGSPFARLLERLSERVKKS